MVLVGLDICLFLEHLTVLIRPTEAPILVVIVFLVDVFVVVIFVVVV